MSLFWQPELKPFAIALMLMLLLGALELISMLFGGVLSAWLESLLPESDLSDFSAPHDSVLNQFFGWLKIRELPVLMSLVVALLEFGVIGVFMQQLVATLFGTMLPALLAALLSIALLLPVLRWSLAGLGRIMPKDESSAVTEESLVGRVAVIILGTARMGSPAEAKVQDAHGFSHYLMVEPDDPSISFKQGEQVLLVRRQSAVYRAIAQHP